VQPCGQTIIGSIAAPLIWSCRTIFSPEGRREGGCRNAWFDKLTARMSLLDGLSVALMVSLSNRAGWLQQFRAP